MIYSEHINWSEEFVGVQNTGSACSKLNLVELVFVCSFIMEHYLDGDIFL